MKEILDQYLPPFITEYVYLPYMMAVWLIVEWVRYQFDGIDNRIKPKHLTLVIGLVVGASCYYGEQFVDQTEVPVRVLIISYFVTTILYEYTIKPLKEKFFSKFNDKQKQ